MFEFKSGETARLLGYPSRWLEDAEVTEGTVLNLAVPKERSSRHPLKKRNSLSSSLLAKVTRKNLHVEVDYGPSVGSGAKIS